MIAALPMYDMVPLRGATDRLWQGIRDRLCDEGLDAPEALTRTDNDLWKIWESPDLLLAQTCSLPFRTRLRGQVALVGTPDYGIKGCPPGYYRSVLLVRANDVRADITALADAPMAFNEPMSQSGWGAPWSAAFAAGLQLRPVLETGSHRASALAVAEGKADWAALDAVTWWLLSRHEPFSRRLRVAGMTESTPGLPFVTSASRDPEPILRACRGAVAALPVSDLNLLGVGDIVRIPASEYLSMPVPPAPW